MYPLPEFKGKSDLGVKEIRKLSLNAFNVGANLASPMATFPPNNVDWQAAQFDWKIPVAAYVNDLKTLQKITSDLIITLTSTLKASSEVAGVDPLWNLMGELATTTLTYPAAFATFLKTSQAMSDEYKRACLAANTTDPGTQELLDAYPVLTKNAVNSLEFLKRYKEGIEEDVTAALFWVAKEGSEREVEMPGVLKEIKKTGYTGYSIMGVIIDQLAGLDYSTYTNIP